MRATFDPTLAKSEDPALLQEEGVSFLACTSRFDFASFWKFEKGRFTAEAQSTQRLRRVLESDLCAPLASFAPLR